VLRLSASVALVTLWMGLPAWLAFRDQITGLLQDPAGFVSPSKLSGGLAGYVVLAFAAVGLFVRRDWRGSLERLGLTALRPSDGLAITAGVAALWLLNAGSEWLERSAFPALWRATRASPPRWPGSWARA